jgi:hypothetical protein
MIFFEFFPKSSLDHVVGDFFFMAKWRKMVCSVELWAGALLLLDRKVVRKHIIQYLLGCYSASSPSPHAL